MQDKRQETNHTYILFGNVRIAKYAFERHRSLHSAENWTYGYPQLTAHHIPTGRMIFFTPIDSVHALIGRTGVVELDDSAEKEFHYDRMAQRRYAEIHQRAADMNARYVHV